MVGEIALRNLLLAGTAALFLTCGAPALADTRPQAPIASSDINDALLIAAREAESDVARGDIGHARDVLQKASKRKSFDTADPRLRRALMLMLAGLAAQSEDWAAAKTAILPATELKEAEGIDWAVRMEASAKLDDREDAVKSMTVLAERFPETLADYTDSFIFNWRGRARALPDGEAKAFALDDALAKGGWKSDDPFADTSDFMRDYAQGLLSRGRNAEAEKAAATIVDRETLIGLRADKIFDAIGGSGQERFLPRIGAVARLKSVEALIKDHPKLLVGQTAKAEALLKLNRAAEALAVAEAAIAKANADPTAFSDMDEALPWAHNLVNDALEQLGRRDQSLEALAVGARVPEHGKPNVSQTLNLSAALVRVGRAKEALATVATVRLDLMSPYGRSVGLWVKVAAATQLGDNAQSQKALAELKALGREGKLNLFEALLYRGDLDGAAALLIERLADPTQRTAALVGVQDTPLAPFPTSYDVDLAKRRADLRVRPDIQAAVAKVGRIEHYAPSDLWPVT
jgi:tetratricopeptide (TPR) repeat protein